MSNQYSGGPYPPRPQHSIGAPSDYGVQSPAYYPDGRPNYGPYQGQGAPGGVWPYGNKPVTAQMNPPDWEQHAANEVAKWGRMPLYYPNPLVPNAPGLVTVLRDYTASFSTSGTGDTLITLNTPKTFNLRFDVTCVLYGFTASAYRTDGSGWPTGSKPTDWFDYDFRYAQGDNIQTGTTILSTVAGSGDNPRWYVGNAHKINNGTVLTGVITPRLDNVAVGLTYNVCEVRGPSNVMPSGW